jgi:hypothetical protein
VADTASAVADDAVTDSLIRQFTPPRDTTPADTL